MLLPLVLLACDASSEAPAIYTVTGPESPPLADPDTQAEVGVALDAGLDAFAGRDTWPELTLTLSSGTWVGETDAVLTVPLAERTLSAWFHPDLDQSELLVQAELTYEGATWRQEAVVDLCPADLGTLTLTVDEAAPEVGNPVTVTATVRTPSGGAPSAGTLVTFTATAAGGATVATLDRSSAPVDETGEVSVELFATGAAGEVTIAGTATRPDWAGCEPLGAPSASALVQYVVAPG